MKGNIPNSLKTVTIESGALGPLCFEGASMIEKLVLREGVTTIGYDCFYSCYSLSDIEFPSTIEELPYAFAILFCDTPYCSNKIAEAKAEGSDGFIYLNDTILAAYYGSEETVEIKEGTVTVADRAFYYSQNVKHITCPNSLRYVGVKSHSTSMVSVFPSTLESIELKDGLEVLGANAFYGASNLNDITIPDSVKYVGYK